MKKITALFLAANPKDTARLRLDEQVRLMTEKIRAAEYRDAIELISVWAVRSDDLLQSLNMHQPHIVHFSGHGTEANELLVEGDDGKSKSIGTATLKALFSTFKDNIRLVILDACYSRGQAEAVVDEIDCVIGMNDAVRDRAAILFMASFYRALGFGRSVQNAFDQAKVALMLEGIPDVDIPKLLCKSGVDPSTIFLVEAQAADNSAKTIGSSIHIGELVMGDQTKKSAGRYFFEHVENSTVNTGESRGKGE